MNNKDLKNKAVFGVIWTLAQRFLSIFVQFISGIILARLLTPDDYGCIGMLTVFTLLASTIIDGGFSSALIQKKRPTNIDYSTILIWNVGFSIIVYGILFIVAPYIAQFYKIEILCPVLRVQGIIVIIGALQSVPANLLNKQMQFKKISIVTLISSIISVIVTIVMAYRGFGVWSLVVQSILTQLIPTVFYWASSKWKPVLVFSTKSFKELFSFGVYMFLTSLMTTLVKNVQSLLIGRFYNASTLGYFSKAANTERLASTAISQVISQVTYPLYAEMQDDKSRLGSTIQRVTIAIAYVTFPLMTLLIIIAKPLFLLLYTERWLDSVIYFQVLCLSGMALCLHSVNGQAIAAIGKSKVMFIWSVIKQSIGMILLVFGLVFWGMNGLLTATVISIWFVYFVNASLVSRHVGYKLRKQLLDLLPILVLVGVTFILSYSLSFILNCNMYILAIFQMIVFAIIYIFSSIVFKIKGLYILIDMLMLILSKFRKNDRQNNK